MPKNGKLLTISLPYGEDAVRFTEMVKEECKCRNTGFYDLDPNDLLDLLIKNVEIKI